MNLEDLVEAFARHTAEQTDAIFRGDAKTGNKHAKKRIAAFTKLRSHGDAGRDALAVLFTHPRMDVRVMAAAYLLRHRTAEAKAVLEETSKGVGLAAFGASEALKRWQEGTWALDPAEVDGASTDQQGDGLGRKQNLQVSIEKLVDEFAHHVAAQTDAIFRGDARTGNKHAKRYAAAFEKLRSHGDAGREELTALFTHPRMDVRVAAASHLLRYRTAEAKAVLQEIAKGEGLAAFEASESLKRWEEGVWALDPE